MIYQQQAAPLAAEREKTEGGGQFPAQIRFIAKQLFFSTPRISKRDRQFLSDLARDEVRYPMKAVERLAGIAKQSTRPAHQRAFAALIERMSTPAAAVEFAKADMQETHLEGEANDAVVRFRHRPTKANQRALAERVDAHIAALRQLRDSALATPVVQ
jgi:hypothetical protein